MVGTPNEAETSVGSKIVSLAFALHPLPSVMVIEIIPAGKALDDGALWGMNYYLQGVDGKVPG